MDLGQAKGNTSHRVKDSEQLGSFVRASQVSHADCGVPCALHADLAMPVATRQQREIVRGLWTSCTPKENFTLGFPDADPVCPTAGDCRRLPDLPCGQLLHAPAAPGHSSSIDWQRDLLQSLTGAVPRIPSTEANRCCGGARHMDHRAVRALDILSMLVVTTGST